MNLLLIFADEQVSHNLSLTFAFDKATRQKRRQMLLSISNEMTKKMAFLN